MPYSARTIRTVMTSVLFSAFTIGAIHVQAQATAADAQKMEALLAASKFTATHVKNPDVAVWTIPRHGATIGDFRVVVTTEKGIVVTFVTVAAKKDIRRTTDLVEAILKLNHDFDYVKSGFDNDSDAYVRIDAGLRLIDVQQLNEIITQVADSAEEQYKVLKPFLLR